MEAQSSLYDCVPKQRDCSLPGPFLRSDQCRLFFLSWGRGRQSSSFQVIDYVLQHPSLLQSCANSWFILLRRAIGDALAPLVLAVPAKGLGAGGAKHYIKKSAFPQGMQLGLRDLLCGHPPFFWIFIWQWGHFFVSFFMADTDLSSSSILSLIRL